jgi:hypothetical protein
LVALSANEADDLSDSIQTSSELRLGGKLTVQEVETDSAETAVKVAIAAKARQQK